MPETPVLLTDEIVPPPALIRARLEALPAIIRAQAERTSRRHFSRSDFQKAQ
jgi:hypothetical protein